MTGEQLEELRLNSLQGIDSKTVKANKNPKHDVKEHEQHLVHVMLCIPGHDPITGKKLHKPYMQKYYPEVYQSMLRDNGFRGYETEVVHMPSNAPGNEAKKKETAEKPIERMNKTELKNKFVEIFGVEPEGNPAPEELRTFITEELAKRAEGGEAGSGEEDKTGEQ